MKVEPLDRMWTVVLPGNAGVVYGLGTSPKHAWENAVSMMGSEKDEMWRAGCRARKVVILLESDWKKAEAVQGLTTGEDPAFRPVEEFMPEDERREWKAHVKEIEAGERND